MTDKEIWSATKAWYNSQNPSVSWQHLTEPERVAVRAAYVTHTKDES